MMLKWLFEIVESDCESCQVKCQTVCELVYVILNTESMQKAVCDVCNDSLVMNKIRHEYDYQCIYKGFD